MCYTNRIRQICTVRILSPAGTNCSSSPSGDSCIFSGREKVDEPKRERHRGERSHAAQEATDGHRNCRLRRVTLTHQLENALGPLAIDERALIIKVAGALTADDA